MKRILLLGDSSKEGVSAFIEQIKPLLKLNAKIVGVDLTNKMNLEKIKADLVLAFGGDGLLLSTARRMGKNQMPVAGVNLGKFGFLADFTIHELKDLLPALLTRKLQVKERMMLDCKVYRNDKESGHFTALNDAVIRRGTVSRILDLKFMVNDACMTHFSGDGMIVATPTGSTAHSLSAGGPIVSPELDAFVITSISPHSLHVRPLVISPDEKITFQIMRKPEEVVLSVDGQMFLYLHESDRVVITKCKHRFKQVDAGLRTFYDTLVGKFKWKGSNYAEDQD